MVALAVRGIHFLIEESTLASDERVNIARLFTRGSRVHSPIAIFYRQENNILSIELEDLQ